MKVNLSLYINQNPVNAVPLYRALKEYAASQRKALETLREIHPDMTERDLAIPEVESMLLELADFAAEIGEGEEPDPEDGLDYSCTDSRGHDFQLQGEDEMRSRCICTRCGADGAA